MTDGSFMKVKCSAEWYFWPALSDNRSSKPILVFFLSGHLRQVLLYLIKYSQNSTDHMSNSIKVKTCI